MLLGALFLYLNDPGTRLANLVVLLSWYRICFFVVFWMQPKLASSQEPGGGGASSALPLSIPQSSPGAIKGPLTRKAQDW